MSTGDRQPLLGRPGSAGYGAVPRDPSDREENRNICESFLSKVRARVYSQPPHPYSPAGHFSYLEKSLPVEAWAREALIAACVGAVSSALSGKKGAQVLGCLKELSSKDFENRANETVNFLLNSENLRPFKHGDLARSETNNRREWRNVLTGFFIFPLAIVQNHVVRARLTKGLNESEYKTTAVEAGVKDPKTGNDYIDSLFTVMTNIGQQEEKEGVSSDVAREDQAMVSVVPKEKGPHAAALAAPTPGPQRSGGGRR